MKAGAAIIDALKKEGTEYVFCFPQNPLIDMAATAGIRPIISRTERATINMADAYSRTTNGEKVGVCFVQAGPGIENAYGGIAQAAADSTPLLIIPGAPVRNRLGLPVSYDAARNYEGITKWTDVIASPAQVEPKLRRAYTQLKNGRSKPILLEVPVDILGEDVTGPEYRPAPRAKAGANAADVREAVKALLSAKRPLIHVGQGVQYAQASAELQEFVELVEVPFMTTTLAKGVIDEKHPLACGHGGVSVTKMASTYLHSADMIFAIGSSLSTTLVSCAIPNPNEKRFVHCTIDESDIGAEYRVDHVVIGDAKLVLRQLIDEAKRQIGAGPRNTGAAAEVASIKKAYFDEWMPALTEDSEPMNPYRVIWDIYHSVDVKNTITTHDSGNVRDQVTAMWEAPGPNSYLGWGNSTQLGTSLGMAMGAKVARPDKLCINFLGDTAFGMCGMDLETAVRERIPVLTVLINNGAMGGYDKYMPIATEKFNSRFLTGDYLKVADGLGYWAERVTKPSEIKPAVARALAVIASGRPAMLECMTKEYPKWPMLGYEGR